MKFGYEKENGYRIETTFDGSVKDYAIMWLHLTNNARENKKVFYKIKNYYDNDITVICAENMVDEVVDYLKRIGLTIKDKCPTTVVIPYIDYEDDEEFGWEIGNVVEV